jgi:uncharacterized repeat protein (TIGR02543 family)
MVTITKAAVAGTALGANIAMDPVRSGYEFAGWKDGAGNVFGADTKVTSNVVVKAQWLRVWTVTFDANGGAWQDGSSSVAKNIVNGASLGSEMPTDPARGGYIFAGWQDDSAVAFGAATRVSGDITVKAQWIRVWTVTFDADGGNWSGQTGGITRAAVNGTALGADIPADPTRSGHTFIGWRDGAGSPFGWATKVTGNITVYAQWADSNTTTCTVTFDADGGSWSGQTANVTKAAVSGSALGTNMPLEPSRSGYVFQGWQDDGGSAFDSSTKVVSNITVKAKWARIWTVTFDADGGGWNGSTADVTRSAIGGASLGAGMPADPARAGYTFVGWKDGSGGQFGWATKVVGNMTVYAQWADSNTQTYTVTFDPNGGSWSGSTVRVTKAAIAGTALGAHIAMDPERDNYEFTGWKDSSGNPFSSATKVVGNMTVRAQWSVSKYVVTFDANGGGWPGMTVATLDKATDINTPIGQDNMPAAPKRKGWTFSGWYGNNNGTGSEFTSATVVAGDMTVYAKWASGTDTDGDGQPDINIDTDGDGKPDINIDTNGDFIPDLNVDTDGDGEADLNVDTDGDGLADLNVDTDGDGNPDVNVDTNGDGHPDSNVDANGEGNPISVIDPDGDGEPNVNIDKDGDGKADLNIDTDGDGNPDINIDTNGDSMPGLNIDTNGDFIPDLNVDTDGDGKADINIDTNGDGIADLNVDTDGDGIPDVNVDTDGDGIPDQNVDPNGPGNPISVIDPDGDGTPNTDIDLDGDGTPDLNIDTDGDGKPDVNIDTNGDGRPDLNVDTDGDGTPDINIDTDGDGKADINIDTDGDGRPDINIDVDGDGKPDINIDVDGDGRPDLNIDTDGDGQPDKNFDRNGNLIQDGLLYVSAGPGGSALVFNGTLYNNQAGCYIVDFGSQARVIARPQANYKFRSWTSSVGFGGIGAADTTFTMPKLEEVRVKADFAYEPKQTTQPPVLPSVAKVKSFGVTQKTIYVKRGKTVKLPLIAYTTAPGKQVVKWKASKPKVASVKKGKKTGTVKLNGNKNAKLTIKAGKKLGTSKITLTAASGKKLVIKVKVVKKLKKVAKKSVKIGKLSKKAAKRLKVGKVKKLTAKFTKKATAIATWKSSKPKVVKIDAAGRITALKKGTAKITLKVGGKKKTIKVRVR